MIRWGQGERRGCCVVIPVGFLLSVLLVLMFTGLTIAKLMGI